MPFLHDCAGVWISRFCHGDTGIGITRLGLYGGGRVGCWSVFILVCEGSARVGGRLRSLSGRHFESSFDLNQFFEVVKTLPLSFDAFGSDSLWLYKIQIVCREHGWKETKLIRLVRHGHTYSQTRLGRLSAAAILPCERGRMFIDLNKGNLNRSKLRAAQGCSVIKTVPPQ